MACYQREKYFSGFISKELLVFSFFKKDFGKMEELFNLISTNPGAYLDLDDEQFDEQYMAFCYGNSTQNDAVSDELHEQASLKTSNSDLITYDFIDESKIAGTRKYGGSTVVRLYKKKNDNSKCEHSLKRSRCKECKESNKGGEEICRHYTKRSICGKCKRLGDGGWDLCHHGNRIYHCNACRKTRINKEFLCVHFKTKHSCYVCKNTNNKKETEEASTFCKHHRADCRKCGV